MCFFYNYFHLQKVSIDTNKASRRTSTRGERLSGMVQNVSISQYVTVSNSLKAVKKERSSICNFEKLQNLFFLNTRCTWDFETKTFETIL